ncbi:class I SAM-dependent methyltransferase [Antrihabitans sp. YC2-6]|uniref:class I SAM-dependent methyltransferase n=1 Tax=Antrihabitans sp. YC2-6 TaxID=2799498 RepID=UPI0018F6FC1D|nr:class I SAM-dependent methyltransferase [Antrihabitans sp. YC2-6]MBJ8343727.1 class I SAM-dependent methyltransferase [Antrihabitans sp. YC2-6]
MGDTTIRRSYTEIADLYIRLFGDVSSVDPDDLRFLERNFGGCGGVVLDVGCGPGHLTAFLVDLGVTAHGIDLVPAFIDYARANRPEITYEVGSMSTLDVPDGSVSGILAWYSLIHCEPTELSAVLAEFRRMLSQGGMLVVGFFEGEGSFAHKVTTAYRWQVDEMSATLHVAGFAEADRLHRPATDTTRPHAALAARAK